VIGGILSANAVDPALLELELTESTLMSDSEAAVQALRSMKGRGIRLALDDFGTGYSSLGYLKRFPLDALKIDRTFIRDVTSDPDDATIVLAIINLARSLKLKVVAEGVRDRGATDLPACPRLRRVTGLLSRAAAAGRTDHVRAAREPTPRAADHVPDRR